MNCYGGTVYLLVSQYGPVTEYDPDSSVPPYRQIVAILKTGIADGTYPPGRPLPSIERLRQEYGIARNTARKVIDALVDEGLAYTEPGMGTYVKADLYLSPARLQRPRIEPMTAIIRA